VEEPCGTPKGQVSDVAAQDLPLLSASWAQKATGWLHSCQESIWVALAMWAFPMLGHHTVSSLVTQCWSACYQLPQDPENYDLGSSR
jgi:hypothetical protein